MCIEKYRIQGETITDYAARLYMVFTHGNKRPSIVADLQPKTRVETLTRAMVIYLFVQLE